MSALNLGPLDDVPPGNVTGKNHGQVSHPPWVMRLLLPYLLQQESRAWWSRPLAGLGGVILLGLKLWGLKGEL